jgi:hypothetical protein
LSEKACNEHRGRIDLIVRSIRGEWRKPRQWLAALSIVGRAARDSELALGVVDNDQTVLTYAELLGQPRLNHNDEVLALAVLGRCPSELYGRSSNSTSSNVTAHALAKYRQHAFVEGGYTAGLRMRHYG